MIDKKTFIENYREALGKKLSILDAWEHLEEITDLCGECFDPEKEHYDYQDQSQALLRFDRPVQEFLNPVLEIRSVMLDINTSKKDEWDVHYLQWKQANLSKQYDLVYQATLRSFHTVMFDLLVVHEHYHCCPEIKEKCRELLLSPRL